MPIKLLVGRILLVVVLGLVGAQTAAAQETSLPIVVNPTEKKQDKPTTDPAAKTAEEKEEKDDTISFETNLVVVNVTVTDGQDNFVGKLKRDDFAILEDKLPQKISSFAHEESPFAAAILIDASGSMEQKMTLARAACASFVEGIREGDVFAIYSFAGTKVKQAQPFGEVRDVTDRLWDLRADGNTPMYDALLQAANDLAERPEKQRAIILVSDGGDSSSKATLDEVMRKVSQFGITIYCVDMTDKGVFKVTPRDNGGEVMKSLTLKTGGRFFAVPAGRELKDAFVQTVNELRNQYILGFEPTNEKKDGKWRILEVSLNRADTLTHRVRARTGYYAPKVKR